MRRDRIRTGATPAASLFAGVILTLSASLEGTARAADSTIKRPGDHPSYVLEVEPHVLFGWGDVYAGYAAGGFGVGARFSIPILSNGFVPTINNSVAISFGADVMHYEACWYHGNCSANYVDLPVVMQWNFFVAQRWSVFGEPGLLFYFGSYADCPLPGNQCPGRPPGAGFEPAFFVGGRYHLSERISLTMRVGFPSLSFGASFFL